MYLFVNPGAMYAKIVPKNEPITEADESPVEDIAIDDILDASVSEIAEAATPVPGGVGPMTIAMLMNNCVEAVELQGK